MAYIVPNGTIHLLHNIPLDNTYQHTLRFSSPANQLAYFTNAGRVKRTFTNQYYTRLNRGIIRVNELADNIYDCNYLIYQNTSFGNKWFYAFIKSVEYVNNAVSQIEFEIDVMQTWYFDFNLQPCFVERMHSTTDAIGDNIVAEPVEPGETVYASFQKEEFTDDLYVIIAEVDTQDQTTLGHMYGRVYGGTTLKVFKTTDVAGINAEIAAFLTRPDAIVNMYMCPQWLISALIDDGGTVLTEDYVLTTPFPISLGAALTGNTPMINGYTPRNKKLYTYPYTSLDVVTPSGGKLKLRYEFFDNGIPTAAIGGSVNLPVELTLIPTKYKGSGLAENGLIGETLTLSNYPLCSWNVDTYKAWAAQNSIPLGMQVVGWGAGILVSAATGNPVGMGIGLTSGINQIINLMSQSYQASIAADQLHGQTSGSSAVAMDTQAFYYGRAVPTEQQTKVIDSFFDMFGYAQKRVMQPLRKARKIWTYLKTVGCVLDGSVPADDANHICKIHDNGITYWDVESNPNINVGNYLLAAQNTVIE